MVYIPGCNLSAGLRSWGLVNSIYPFMKTKTIILLPLGLVFLCAGCVGTGPNTQQGAVSGGILGAIAGGIIGNNSGNGNGAGGAVLGATAGAIVGGTIGNQIDHERGTIYTSEKEATTQVVLDSPPPPPPRPPRREVVYVRSAPEAIWIEGHWVYITAGGISGKTATGKSRRRAITTMCRPTGSAATTATFTSGVIGVCNRPKVGRQEAGPRRGRRGSSEQQAGVRVTPPAGL